MFQKFRKNIRLKYYDYRSDGVYFVTTCTFNKQLLINSDFKKLIKRELLDLEKRFKGVKIDFWVSMPTHLHIIFILYQSKVSLSRVIQTFKSITTLKLKRSGFKEKVFWQPNYYEHVIRNEKALNAIRKYIINNPDAERLKIEEFYK